MRPVPPEDRLWKLCFGQAPRSFAQPPALPSHCSASLGPAAKTDREGHSALPTGSAAHPRATHGKGGLVAGGGCACLKHAAPEHGGSTRNSGEGTAGHLLWHDFVLSLWARRSISCGQHPSPLARHQSTLAQPPRSGSVGFGFFKLEFIPPPPKKKHWNQRRASPGHAAAEGGGRVHSAFSARFLAGKEHRSAPLRSAPRRPAGLQEPPPPPASSGIRFRVSRSQGQAARRPPPPPAQPPSAAEPLAALPLHAGPANPARGLPCRPRSSSQPSPSLPAAAAALPRSRADWRARPRWGSSFVLRARARVGFAGSPGGGGASPRLAAGLPPLPARLRRRRLPACLSMNQEAKF